MTTPKKQNPGSSRFKPGKSGNPGGRSPRVGPNGETIVQLCRAKTNALIERAAAIALDPMAEHKDALTAIFGLLDRGWGKPKESVDLDARVEGAAIPIIQFVRQPDPDQS
ncbi:hypothetical protein [Lysobacter sp. HA35]